MPEFKLIYFNARGRAEITRWIFAYGNIPYTDERIEFSDWPARKPTIYTNKVPVLMVDGVPLPESLAIARYAAKLAGLVPEDNFLAAKVDAWIDTFGDKHLETRKIIRSSVSNEEKARMMREELFPNVLAPFLKDLNKELEGREWYVGDKVTWLDLNSAVVFNGFLDKIPNLLDEFPNVQKHMLKVMDLPRIKEWVAKRPQTFI